MVVALVFGDLRRLTIELLDAVFPRLCPLCRSSVGSGFGCEVHALALDFERGPPGPHCGRCARVLGAALPDRELCAHCRRGETRVRRIVTLWDYARDGPLRDWVLALKHGGRRDLARPLGNLLGQRLRAAVEPGAPPLLVPVPLHVLRRFERGYDQAGLLARSAAEAAGVEHLRALGRRRWTPPQGAPGARSRQANVRGAFRLLSGTRERVAGRAVWLVDDVVGSGATVEACRAELVAGGAASVSVLALARAADTAPGLTETPAAEQMPR